MSQHYPLNVLSTSAWCKKCGAMTQHKVSHRRLQFCILCWDNSKAKSDAEKLAESKLPKQESFLYD